VNDPTTRPSTRPPLLPTIDVAGFKALANYGALVGRTYSKSPEELDRPNLEKLWHTGFDVATLDEAHTTFRLSPLRDESDVWRLLGHAANPKNHQGTWRFTEAILTTLAIQYPSLLDKGETYPHSQIIRVRYPSPLVTIRAKTKDHGPAIEARKYDQPLKQYENQSSSEPYFLFRTDQWTRLYDTSLPLLITEGEMKAAALGLADHAAIAFGGAQMWTAPKKSGKNRLHPSLDPDGPRKAWSIPIKDRDIYLVPDLDYRTNQAVRKAFYGLAQALIGAGANNPVIIDIPDPPRPDLWKGIDDYFTHHVGPRWSRDPALIEQVRKLLADLMADGTTVRQTDRYIATSVTRGADRLFDRLQRPENYTGVLIEDSDAGQTRVGWMLYHTDRYTLVPVEQTIGNTNGKVTVPNMTLQRIAANDYEVGVDQAIAEGDITDKPDDMPLDYPNRVLAAVNRQLPEHNNYKLLGPISGVEPGDFCVRTNRALVDLTKCMKSGVDWDNRAEWLLPPNSRWWSTGCMNVTLANLAERPICPTFLGLLRNGFDGDEERIRCLQMFFGRVISSPMFLHTQQFLALYGKAGSGKSTIYRILLELLGPQNVGILRAQFGGRFDTGNLPGKSLIVFQETPDGSTGDFAPYMAEVIKQVTGEDSIAYERKGQQTKSIMVKANMLTIGNDPPIIPMDVTAFERRAVFLRMSNVIGERDSRKEKIMRTSEMPGIFLWGLEGAAMLNSGLRWTTPAACREDLQDVTISVDPEHRYVATQFQLDERGQITTSQLAEHYQGWIREHRMRYRATATRKVAHLIRERWGIGSTTVRVNGQVTRAFVGLSFTQPLY